MLNLNNLLDQLNEGRVDTVVAPFDFNTTLQNQMLFFIKPEVFLLEKEDMAKTVTLIWKRLVDFGVEIRGCYLMSAETLEARQIMDRHYGYINQVSRMASSALSETDRDELRRLCGVDENAPIKGGHEVLAENSELTAKGLDDLWASKKSKRLRSGLYAEAFELDGIVTVIVNGFHPYQLEHFTGSGRKICLLLLNSDLPWRMLRVRMLGDTFPEKALPGSIRGDLNRSAADYGFADVTIANNCAHMSAGTYEAVFEFKNFMSGVSDLEFSTGMSRQAAHFRDLGMAESDLERALSNPTAQIGAGTSSSLFDSTEESDALSAAATYHRFYTVDGEG